MVRDLDEGETRNGKTMKLYCSITSFLPMGNFDSETGRL